MSAISEESLSIKEQSEQSVFPPGSAVRQVNREAVVLLCGGRVLLMQIAHPMVAEAVYDHSYVFSNPLKRLYRTLNLTSMLVFGSHAEFQEALDEIESVHRPATGRIEHATGKHKAGATYNPRNPRQALWVFATLVEGSISSYEQFVGPLDDATKEEYYQQTKQIAARMDVRPSYLPDDYPALLTYMHDAIADGEICVSDKAQEIAPFILGQSIPGVNLLAYPLYRLSVGLLPEALQTQFGYNVRDWEISLLNGFSRVTRRVVPWLPDRLRYIPPWHRARNREKSLDT